jgi:hypothetical protein
MKSLLFSAAVALAATVGTMAPASAQVTITGPGMDRGRDCRTVEKRVVRNGRTVITRNRSCNSDRRSYRSGRERYVERREYRDRRDYRRDDRPGIQLNLGR